MAALNAIPLRDRDVGEAAPRLVDAWDMAEVLLTALRASAASLDGHIALYAPGGVMESADGVEGAAVEHAALVQLRDMLIEPAIARAEAVLGTHQSRAPGGGMS